MPCVAIRRQRSSRPSAMPCASALVQASPWPSAPRRWRWSWWSPRCSPPVPAWPRWVRSACLGATRSRASPTPPASLLTRRLRRPQMAVWIPPASAARPIPASPASHRHQTITIPLGLMRPARRPRQPITAAADPAATAAARATAAPPARQIPTPHPSPPRAITMTTAAPAGRVTRSQPTRPTPRTAQRPRRPTRCP